MKATRHLYPLFLIFLISFFSCSKDDIDLSDANKEPIGLDKAVAEALTAMGFSPLGAEVLDEHYLVEGDILVQKSLVDRYNASSAPSDRVTEQARTASLINLGNQRQGR